MDSPAVSKLLKHIPDSWLGTTYPNDGRFVGRDAFIAAMEDLVFPASGTSASLDDGSLKDRLSSLFPEDYVRLGSPLSTLLEVVRAKSFGLPARNVFSFGSPTLPIIASLLASPSPASFLYGATSSFEPHVRLLNDFFHFNISMCEGEPTRNDEGGLVLVLLGDGEGAPADPSLGGVVDALVGLDGFLYVLNTTAIAVDDVLSPADGTISREGLHTLRKRLGGPAPTPDALTMLRDETPLASSPSSPEGDEFQSHLKELAGVPDAPGSVLLGTTGLAALSTIVMAVAHEAKNNVDLVQCSTAYGGSAQQADILTARVAHYTKHTYDIQGGRPVFSALEHTLETMKSGPSKPITFIQLEYPTNPDMKDCSLTNLESLILDYESSTGSKAVLLFDTTFSPVSQVARGRLTNVAVLVFNSLSKSVSGGFTTGGSVVANHHPLAQKVLETAHRFLQVMGTTLKPSQLSILLDNHKDVERRVAAAHKNAAHCANHLEESVKKVTGKTMKVNFVTKEQIAKNVTPATFSFNLPGIEGSSRDLLANMAQRMVDLLVTNFSGGVKPCVSFGQQNELVYATVPATSTQGVLSEAVKAKQAIGGVQLVRFSFPPKMDLSAWENAIESALEEMYGPARR